MRPPQRFEIGITILLTLLVLCVIGPVVLPEPPPADPASTKCSKAPELPVHWFKVS